MVRAAGSSLTCGLGAYSTLSKAHTNWVPDQYSLYTDGQHALAFNTKCGSRYRKREEQQFRCNELCLCGLGPYGTLSKTHTNSVPYQCLLYLDGHSMPNVGLDVVSVKSSSIDVLNSVYGCPLTLDC